MKTRSRARLGAEQKLVLHLLTVNKDGDRTVRMHIARAVSVGSVRKSVAMLAVVTVDWLGILVCGVLVLASPVITRSHIHDEPNLVAKRMHTSFEDRHLNNRSRKNNVVVSKTFVLLIMSPNYITFG